MHQLMAGQQDTKTTTKDVSTPQSAVRPACLLEARHLNMNIHQENLPMLAPGWALSSGLADQLRLQRCFAV